MALASCGERREATDGSTTGRCELHDTALLTVTGYVPNKDVMADPTVEYGMFIGEFRDRYPHKTPWWFSKSADEGAYEKESAEVCPECDREFKSDYDAYLELDEKERDRRWRAFLRTQGPQHPPADTPDKKGAVSESDSPLPPLDTR